MDSFSYLLAGFAAAFSPENLLFLVIGVTLGMVVGVLPGLGPATGIALLIPLTTSLDPLTALIMLAGIYYGSQYGGSVTSILLRTPGEASSVMTAIDGYEMSRKGQAGRALAISAVASFVAGTLTIPLLMVLAPALTSLALSFGPPELFALMLFALISVATMTARSQRAKSIAACAIGVWISTIGFDPQTGQDRFTFGVDQLLLGVAFIPVVIGVFAIAEVLRQVGTPSEKPIRTRFRDMLLTRKDVKDTAAPIGRSTFLGFFLGAIPGAGATIASYFAYDVEKRIGRNRAQFGKGAIEGVAAPEAANNSAVNGAFIPALTLGIPGSATTAILLGAMILYGIAPGPNLLNDEPELVWGLISSFYLGNVLLLVMALLFVPAFASLLRIPYSLLYPVIIAVSLFGGFSIANSMLDVWMVVLFGAVGLLMARFGYPAPPLVLGLILGGMMETALIQSSSMGRGDLSLFFTRPLSLALLIGTALLLLVPPVVVSIRLNRMKTAERAERVR
ncbi:tripartite tricarboxylate transporter permease [Microbacterium sp. LWS13-1.2]|uniref:Tripartite tricarboxylate transporter permease n=1 Tax=Microbacterium sp. LWS13-1.2 TaxID=3135264 RepID=A0AAU6SE72_9MICO